MKNVRSNPYFGHRPVGGPIHLFTRLFPFVVFGRKGGTLSHGQTAGRPAAPFCHRHLGHLLLKNTTFDALSGFAPQFIAIAVVAAPPHLAEK